MEPTNQPVINQGAPSQATEHKKVGPIVAILVIVLILIIGALYIFATKINQSAIPTDNTTADMSATQPASDGTVPTVTNKADDMTSLQGDLNASTNGLDKQNF